VDSSPSKHLVRQLRLLLVFLGSLGVSIEAREVRFLGAVAMRALSLFLSLSSS